MKAFLLAAISVVLWGCNNPAPDPNRPQPGAWAPPASATTRTVQSQPASAGAVTFAPMNEANLVRLIAELAARVPGGWYVADVHTGELTPPGCPGGMGHCIRLTEVPLTWADLRGDKGHWAEVFLISPGSAPAGPGSRPSTAPHMPTSNASPAPVPARELQTWHDWHVLVAQDARYAWPKFEQEVAAALRAADGPPAAAKPGALPPLVVGRLDVSSAPHSRGDSITGFYLDGYLTDPNTRAMVEFRIRPWHGGAAPEFVEFIGRRLTTALDGSPAAEQWRFVLPCAEHLACFRGDIAVAVLPLASLGSRPKAKAQKGAATTQLHKGPDHSAVIVVLPPGGVTPGPVTVLAYKNDRLLGSWVVRAGEGGAVIGTQGPGVVTLMWTWPDGGKQEKLIEVTDKPVRVLLDNKGIYPPQATTSPTGAGDPNHRP